MITALLILVLWVAVAVMIVPAFMLSSRISREEEDAERRREATVRRRSTFHVVQS